MGKIRKLKENELLGGRTQNDIYPVTATLAVFNRKGNNIANTLVCNGGVGFENSSIYIILKNENNDTVATIQIPSATLEQAGVLSASDKGQIDANTEAIKTVASELTRVEEGITLWVSSEIESLKTSISSSNEVASRIDGNTFNTTADGMTLTTVSVDTLNSHTVTIPSATEETAGVLIAEDKTLINNIKNSESIEEVENEEHKILVAKDDNTFYRMSPKDFRSITTQYISESEYNRLVEEDLIDENVEYNIYEDE